jgi:hypothetical protein
VRRMKALKKTADTPNSAAAPNTDPLCRSSASATPSTGNSLRVNSPPGRSNPSKTAGPPRLDPHVCIQARDPSSSDTPSAVVARARILCQARLVRPIFSHGHVVPGARSSAQ